MKYHIRVAWCPPFDSISSEQSTKLLQLVNEGKKNYQIQFTSSYLWAYRSTTPFRLDESGRYQVLDTRSVSALSFGDMEAKGYKIETGAADSLEVSIRILPRSKEELILLQEWYLELPVVSNYGPWIRHVFVHPRSLAGSFYEYNDRRIGESYEAS